MTSWPDLTSPRGIALATVFLATLLAGRAADETRTPPAAAGDALPPWMEMPALATNAAAWADLATTWNRGLPRDVDATADFTAPVEHYADGRIRAILHAAKGAIGHAGMIWGWGVTVSLFDPAGRPDGRIDAASCLYDRATRRGYCPAEVSLSRTNVAITGTGLFWSMNAQRMQILTNPVVRLQRGAAGVPTETGGATPARRHARDLRAPRTVSAGGTSE
jgi:hypothetical protein